MIYSYNKSQRDTLFLKFIFLDALFLKFQFSILTSLADSQQN